MLIQFPSFLLSTIAILSLVGCGTSKTKPEATSPNISITTNKEINLVETECFSPQFSYRGDQILYICQDRKFNSQPQLFIEDLNTGLRKQVTFQDGILKEPHFLRPDFLIYLSSTDKRKEHIPLLIEKPKPIDELEVYSFDLRNDEIERVTDNSVDEIAIVPLKHIDPKMALVRLEANTYKVYLKNLANSSEKLMFKTNHKISEIGVNDSNQLLIVEDTGYKKWVRLIENDKKQTLWPEFKKEAQSFSLDSKTGDLEYLEDGKVKTLSLKNYCESEVFSLPGPVLEIQKSPVVDNLYVYTTLVQGLRRIEHKVIQRNPTQSCKKIVRRR
tara:strand:- start:109485 stop:110471 length:987 start_codon:yes stop_codon:yes gene_type:complete